MPDPTYTEPERVQRVEFVELRPDLWQLVVVGSKGTRHKSSLYNTKSQVEAAGQHRIGMVMR